MLISVIKEQSNALAKKLTDSVSNPHVIALFRKCLYLFLLINTLILLPVADEIWGPNNSMISYYNSDAFLLKFLNILSYHHFEDYYLFFVWGQIIFLIIGLTGKYQRLTSIFIYLFSANLYMKATNIQNAGNNVTLLMLIYLIFMNEHSDKNKTSPNLWNIIDTTCTNLAFSAAKIQLVVLYAVAGIYKLKGEHWLDGTALYYVLHIDEFSHPFIQKHFTDSAFITYTGTYFTLFFQLSFPLLVWFQYTRKIMLFLGTILHLLIAFGLGITDFGLVMLIMYMLFYSNERSKQLLEKISFPKNNVLPTPS